LFVIPEGDLRLLLFVVPIFVIPEGDLRFTARATAISRRGTMPKREYTFWIYILSNRSHVLYIGVTNNLGKRVTQHRKPTPGSFTTRYKITRLVYFDRYQYIDNAIAREKGLKHWTRAQKIALIESNNPTWEDLMPAVLALETQIPFGDDNKGKQASDV
jgi:putative endonuclease